MTAPKKRKPPKKTIIVGNIGRDTSERKKKGPPPAKRGTQKPIKKLDRANKSHRDHRRASSANDPAFSAATTKAMSCAEQRAFVLSALAIGRQTSYFFRSNGCYQVPTRVHELRKLGHDIRTSLITIVDADSWSHPRCALYELGDQDQFGLDFGREAENDPVSPKKGSKK